MHVHSTCGSLYSDYSSRSRVRGYLEVYHAFLKCNTTNTSVDAEEQSDREWEVVNASEDSTPATVSN